MLAQTLGPSAAWSPPSTAWSTMLLVGLLVLASSGVGTAVAQSFTDDPLVPGVTPIKAVHFRELRARIDMVRALVGLPEYAWTETLTPGLTPIRRAHLIEMRTALNEAYSSARLPRPPYTEPALGAGTPIRAAHITDLRTAVVRLREDAKPDLVVERPTIWPSQRVAPNQFFTLTVTVRNRGSAPADAPLLLFIESINPTITWADQVITIDDSIPALAAGESSEASVDLFVRIRTTLFLGACIDPVSRESDIENNCSPSVLLRVE